MSFAAKHNIPFIDADYDMENWFVRVKGMEHEPEKEQRCTECFECGSSGRQSMHMNMASMRSPALLEFRAGKTSIRSRVPERALHLDTPN